MDYERRAPRSSQKIEVLQKKDEIVALLAVGVPYAQIRIRVGLHDMAETTFRYHASRLREAAGISPYRSQTGIPQTTAGGQPRKKMKPASGTIPRPEKEEPSVEKPPQPETAIVDEPDDPPRKRRKFVQVEVNRTDDDDPGFNPAKWDDTKI